MNNSIPPKAKKIPVEIKMHGDIRIDNYQWLKDKNNPEVIEHLKAENAFAESYMEDTKTLQQKIYDEFIGRIKQDDVSVPYKRGEYMYYEKRETGKEYPIYYRKKISDGNEEMILDVNKIAENLPFCNVEMYPSEDNNILAYLVDSKGDHSCTGYFLNLQSGKLLKDSLRFAGNIIWTNDNSSVFYIKYEEGNMGKQLFLHKLGQEQEKDKLVFQLEDEKFWIEINKSSSKKYIFIDSFSFVDNELYYIYADNYENEPKLIQKRIKGVRILAEHNADKFFIYTNLNAPNYRVMTALVENPSEKNWVEFIPEKENVKLEETFMFKDFFVLVERDYGLRKIKVINLKNNRSHYVNFPEPVYSIFIQDNYEFDTKYLRFNYTSLKTPVSYYDHDMENGENILLKETEVLGGYNKEDYVTERIFAPSHDGKLIPLSVLYKKGLKKDGSNPLFLYSYGSYGLSSEIFYNSFRLSLLERGFIYVTAHIRGGGELGEQWYIDGKMLNKKNTFLDFISCAEYLIEQGYTYKGGITASGTSAGGLLMGAISNMKPELFKCIMANVPAADVINSLLDPDVPNAALHFEELGNPNIKEHYDYMKSYCPYENINEQSYPNMLITTGLNDISVPFWEPVKFAAKLKEFNKSGNVIILKTDFDSGHMGTSGRYNLYKKFAFDYAFILKCYGIKE